DFFTGVDEAESTPVFFAAHQLKVMDNGAIRFRQLGDQLQGRSMQIMSETYPPGADTGETMLAHDSEEGGFVVRGRIEVTVGHQSTLLGPGDGYYFDSRLPHRFRNVGDETCELISACSPPSF
nr:cupin domain-containing protein [Denitromonas sp.]